MLGARVALDLGPAEGLTKGGIRKATRIGLNRAASPVKASVVSHAAAVKRFGYLSKSIRIRLKGYPADKWVSVIGPGTKFVKVKGRYKRGATPGAAKFFKPAKYAHLVERGTKRSKPKPWLRPAFDSTKGRFLDQAAAEVGKEIAAELARHRAKPAT
jgi:HK97 gp10 family phage protein